MIFDSVFLIATPIVKAIGLLLNRLLNQIRHINDFGFS
jgi:hypothetical protein